MTKHWPIQDAKARFSALIEASASEGPQIITKRGVETAVVLPIEEWRRLSGDKAKTAKYLLLDDPRRFELDLPDRKAMSSRRRTPIDFD